MRTRVVILSLLLTLLAACAAPSTDTTSATSSPPTSAAPATSTVTTTMPATTPTTTPDTTSSTLGSPEMPDEDLTPVPDGYSVATLSVSPPPLVGGDGAAGSGCAPGADSLPDGAWFGFVTDRTETGIVFDLACWWSGDRANEVALEHGETDVPVPNDYYISNDADRVRMVAVPPDVPVSHLDYSETNTSGDPYVALTFAEWGGLTDYLNCDFDSEHEPFCLVWLFINDGGVTEMAEQYVP